MKLIERFFSIFEEPGKRLDLMQRMLQKTDVIDALEQRHCNENDLRSAIVACLRCPHGDACKAWADTATSPSLPPDFCLNAAQLRRLAKNRKTPAH